MLPARTGTWGASALTALIAGAAVGLSGCGATAVVPHLATRGAASPATATPTTATPATATPARPTAPAPTLAGQLMGVGAAGQVVAVSATSYGSTTATFTAYQRVPGGWQQVFGPWTADIGYGGFAQPGHKHEGDGKTPSGSYAFDFFFGVAPDPGVAFPWRTVTASNVVWDDDPASAHYNQWVDTSTGTDPGRHPEPMDNVPVYDYGAVIAYNEEPVVSGAGSAIFLHVSDGGPTAGCVSLPVGNLLAVLRWLDPARAPRIIMGTAASITAAAITTG